MRTLDEMRNLVSDKKTKTLFLSDAKTLVGKEISTIFFGYDYQDGVDNFVVGEIVSMYDFAKREKIDGWESRAAYWDSYMRPAQLSEMKRILTIITNDGRDTHISCFIEEGVFWCSDSDRYVHYIVENENAH